MKIQTWLYCFFLLPHFLFGQKQIKGQILDGANHQPLAGVHVYWLGAIEGSVSNASGEYQIAYNPLVNSHLRFVYPGYRTLIQKVEHTKSLNVQLWAAHLPLVEYDTLIAFDPETYEEQVQIVAIDRSGMNQPITNGINASQRSSAISSHSSYSPQPSGPIQTSNFARIEENQDQLTFDQPLSTFSIDVDQAAYSIVRNAIHQEGIVPIDAVRIEELINYFNYDYPQPEKEHPFSIYTELAECPWNAKRQLLHIGLKGREIVEEELPPSHLVFLLDVSGSMDSPQKLPLLKKAFLLLIESLRPEDKVSIVVYAGAAGLVLPPTTGDEKATIRHAIEHLTAGGSTAGGEGIQLAYQLAKDHFLPEGNNRVILATDGDFNVGISSDGALSRLIEQKREEQIFLTVIGLGTGNYKDHKLELLADKGNGHYVYLDNEQEARKVFVEGLRSNLYSIAKDVKIQIEFNPALVQSYRLVGYENRLLEQTDFQDDQKDAGELGAGHTVTALYELVLNDSAQKKLPSQGIPLRYQKQQLSKKGKQAKEIGMIHFRYKSPQATTSRLLRQRIWKKQLAQSSMSTAFRFAAAVAGFGLLLRQSAYAEALSWSELIQLANASLGEDQYGHRAAFVALLRTCQTNKIEEKQGQLLGF